MKHALYVIVGVIVGALAVPIGIGFYWAFGGTFPLSTDACALDAISALIFSVAGGLVAHFND